MARFIIRRALLGLTGFGLTRFRGGVRLSGLRQCLGRFLRGLRIRLKRLLLSGGGLLS
jgi:hypothetical protein